MLRKFIVAAALMPLMLGCAPFAMAGTEDVTSDQMALIDATCTHVMGLRKGESYFAECRDSLASSLARRVAAMAAADADRTCRQQGLSEGSPALSTCMLDARGRAAGLSLAPTPIADTAAIEAGKSYYNVGNSVHFQRERYSCAQLGLMPGSGLFGECVASLEGALLPDPN